MANVKPGDRAIVIKSTYPENISIIVSVVKQIKPGEKVPAKGVRNYVSNSPEKLSWVVESLGKSFKYNLYDDEGRFVRTNLNSIAVAHDASLRRLPDEEDVKNFDVTNQAEDLDKLISTLFKA